MKVNSKKYDVAMKTFEEIYYGNSFVKFEKKYWEDNRVYQDPILNCLFKAFLQGYQFALIQKGADNG